MLVTGLWMGNPQEGVGCYACNYDFSWLFTRPSTLIWADKIILTQAIKKTIEEERQPHGNKALAQSIKKTIEVATEYDLIETRDSSEIVNEQLMAKIDQEVTFDRDLLGKLYPNQVRLGDEAKVPGQMFIEGKEYCYPRIMSIYTSLILAKAWNAQCLFSDEVLDFCKYKFGTSIVTDHYAGQSPKAFDTIFSSFLPEGSIFPDYSLFNKTEDLCPKCSNEKKCSEEFLTKLEDNLTNYLEMRECDEVTQIRSVLSDIIYTLESGEGKADHDSIVREFRNEEKKLTKRIRKTFPKVNRWSNIALIASVPATAIGLATGLPMVSVIGASIAGLSTTAKASIEYLESKYKWIGFITKKVTLAPQTPSGS